MSYDGQVGWSTILPTAKRPPSGGGSSARARSGSSARAARPRKKKAAVKIPRGKLQYPKITAKNPLGRAPTSVELGIGAISAPKIARAVRAAAGSRAALLTLTEAGLIRTIPVAGLGAYIGYALTKWGLSRFALKKATMRENAANAANAYRDARLKVAEDQGRPLTLSQQKQLAAKFKNALIEIGISSRDLSKIMGRSAYDPTPPPATSDEGEG